MRSLVEPPRATPVSSASQAASPATDPAPFVDAADELVAVDDTNRRLVPLLAVVLGLVVLGGTVDLVLDRPTNWRSLHVAFELGIILLSLTFAGLLWRGWWRTARALRHTRQALASTRRSLAERQAEHEAWRRRAEVERAGFGRAVDAQFAKWGLTPTEREVAFLLLQGHGHKQIAARTGRGERTVRQHAVAVYQKSGIDGRAELAAFFLQDLFPTSDAPREEG
ncbi:MAG: helix-turn-helix transcriptional regulator [bacterium]